MILKKVRIRGKDNKEEILNDNRLKIKRNTNEIVRYLCFNIFPLHKELMLFPPSIS